jgi:hypothetical protein
MIDLQFRDVVRTKGSGRRTPPFGGPDDTERTLCVVIDSVGVPMGGDIKIKIPLKSETIPSEVTIRPAFGARGRTEMHSDQRIATGSSSRRKTHPRKCRSWKQGPVQDGPKSGGTHRAQTESDP